MLDALLSGLGGDRNKTKEEQLKEVLENAERCAEIEKEVTKLQDGVKYESGDNRIVTSSIWEPTEGTTITGNAYSIIDSEDMCLGDELLKVTELIKAQNEAEGVENDEDDIDDNFIEMMAMLGKNVKISMGFSVTVTATSCEIRILKDGDIVNHSTFKNVRSADDLLKLVSFHDAKFVDPLLADFETIKTKVFGK